MVKSQTTWKPWHQVVKLREDVRNESLTLADFAADLYDVVMQEGKRPIYEDPTKFFALTYPTLALREIARDVIHRLAAKNTKAIRQLELTYGGGKTHTLITLRHLVANPDSLPDLNSIKEFKAHIGLPIPKSCVATLCFDKLDFEKGMNVRSPSGEFRWLKRPWSVLAYQIAGNEGLSIIHADGKSEERETPPAEPLMVELLSMPQKYNQSTLILIDEVLMYAANKLALVDEGESYLTNFFQYLCQAVTKIDNCAMVASLLASDPERDNEFGKRIYNQISQIFGRQRDEGVQPVEKEDVAEVLRRRFFEQSTINDAEAFRPNVAHSISNIEKQHLETRKERKKVEERFLSNFPFHPDLTEIFYTRWSQLSKFQNTRGILRIFALALRDAEKWDTSPLIGPNVFLSEPGQEKLSEAARELATTASREQIEGSDAEWGPILEGELSKARNIQLEQNVFSHREIEQIVFSVFFSSQPIGQKAHTPDLISLVGSTGPDHIELEKALQKWTELSWFLDETEFDDFSDSTEVYKNLPKSWRLGNKPNLKQMHDSACKNRVPSDSIEEMLISQIGQNSYLKKGVSTSEMQIHTLPERPKDVADDGEFHFVVLGPNAVSDTQEPSTIAKKFINETTGQDRPRTHRNSIIIVTPSKEGLNSVKSKIREHLGWEEVRLQLEEQASDSAKDERVSLKLKQTLKQISEAICQAWTTVVTVNEKNEIHAFKISVGNTSLFSEVKSDKKSRIQETPISTDALLPGGPYDLWRENEDFRLVKDLTSAFATSPNLPKMLQKQKIYETIRQGIYSGKFVALSKRPDSSIKTFWHSEVDNTILNENSLEIYLPDKIELTELDPNVLKPNLLPELWNADSISVSDIIEYFSEGKIVEDQKEGYSDFIRIPKCSKENIEESISKSIEQGILRIVDGSVSFQGEKIPNGILSDSSQLLKPIEQIEIEKLLPSELKDSWKDEQTNGLALSIELSKNFGFPIPWSVLCNSIENAITSGFLDYASSSVRLPCGYHESKELILKLPSGGIGSTSPAKKVPTLTNLEANQLQDLIENLPDILEIAGELQLKFQVSVALDHNGKENISNTVQLLNERLKRIDSKLKVDI